MPSADLLVLVLPLPPPLVPLHLHGKKLINNLKSKREKGRVGILKRVLCTSWDHTRVVPAPGNELGLLPISCYCVLFFLEITNLAYLFIDDI